MAAKAPGREGEAGVGAKMKRASIWLLIAGWGLAAELVVAARFQPVGGRPADPADHPYFLALSRYQAGATDRRYFCGATLLGDTWAVTAAHCFHDSNGERLPADDLWALNGQGNLLEASAEQHVGIAQVVLHPEYDPVSQTNDIALIQLARPIAPSLLPVLEDERETGGLFVLGFGSQSEGEPRQTARAASGEQIRMQSSRLLKAPVPRVAAADCLARLTPERLEEAGLSLGPLQICAGGGSTDACQGDSGGPLLGYVENRHVLVGVTSYGFGCGRTGLPGVYTRASAYRAWIAQVMRE
jgi:secreted trypsin-like serine protease